MKTQRIKEEIIKLAHYYNQDLHASTLDVYAQHLQDMDEETFRLAIDRHVETSEWMPKVSQIRDAAMQNFIKRAGVPAPADAWGEVSKYLHEDTSRNVGTLTNINRIDDHQWSHPLVREAADKIGWQDMWRSKDDNVVSNRARYMDAYRDLLNDLKTHYKLTPNLRDAIEPPEQPQLVAPIKKEIETPVQDPFVNGFMNMPKGAKERLDKIRERMEVPHEREKSRLMD